jgi:hypothetical protein
MSLSVPPVGDILSAIDPYRGVYSPAVAYPQAPLSTDVKIAEVHGDSYKVRYDPIRQELVLEQDKPCPIRRGDWIVLITTLTNGKIQVHIDPVKLQSRAGLCVSRILLCPV